MLMVPADIVKVNQKAPCIDLSRDRKSSNGRYLSSGPQLILSVVSYISILSRRNSFTVLSKSRTAMNKAYLIHLNNTLRAIR